MHISEGVLSAPVLITGVTLSVACLAVGIRQLNMDTMPKAAMMSAVFFCGSFIHINLGPGSVHLVLNGMIGILMGWISFPSICIALLLQGILFQFGGLTTLGINTFNVAGPAVVGGMLFHLASQYSHKPLFISLVAGFIGAFTVALTGVMAGLSLYFSAKEYSVAAYTLFFMHIPVMLIEAIITFLCIRFLLKVDPELIIPTMKIKRHTQKALSNG